MSKSKKLLVWFLAIVLIVTFACPTIRYYTLPKVCAIAASKGRITGSTEIYDCVIPKSAVQDGVVWCVSPRVTVLGTTYIAYSRDVFIEAEDETRCAVDLSYMGENLIVIAHDGELTDRGDVIVVRS